MIGFESNLTGADVISAVTNAHELFSGDMTPGRIRDVVEKFEKDSGGYKEIDAFWYQNDLYANFPVIIVANPLRTEELVLSINADNLMSVLDHEGIDYSNGFHRLKFNKGIVFTYPTTATPNSSDISTGVFKEVYIDLTILNNKFYGEFLVPGILKGVFTINGTNLTISVRSILCPYPTNLGNILYSKIGGDIKIKYQIELNFFSDALLLYPIGYRRSYSAYNVNDEEVYIDIDFYTLSSGHLVALFTCSNGIESNSFKLYGSMDSYYESFYLRTTAYQGSQFTGSFTVVAPSRVPVLESYLPFCKDHSFINQ